MFSNISWSSYWLAVSIIVSIYYVYILLVYYQGTISSFVTSNQKPVAGTNPPATSPRQGSTANAQTDDLFPIAESLSDEISAYLEQAGRQGYVKQDVVGSLSSIIRKYPGVKDSDYRGVINKLVKFECREKCTIHLDVKEVEELWKDDV